MSRPRFLSCENLARGRVLLDCGATGTDGSVEAIEAIIDKSQEAFGTDHDWLSVHTNDQPVYKFGDAKRKQALSKDEVQGQPGGHVAYLHVHVQETEGVPELLSAKSLTALGAVINFETGHAIFRNLEPETVAQLERSPFGHLWMDLFEHMPVVVVRSREVRSKCWFDVAKLESSCVGYQQKILY